MAKKSTLTDDETAALRREMHAQVPIARAQIRSLRTLAQTASDLAASSSAPDKIGHVLSAVLLAGFALELGLKIFSMTYRNERPRGHDLQTLFDALPSQIRGDIDATFEASEFRKPNIELIALISSPGVPATPTRTIDTRYDTAENVVRSSAHAFTKARYFFENVQSRDWAIVANPVHYMLILSNVIDVVYDEYLRRGGWADPPERDAGRREEPLIGGFADG